MTTTHKTPIQDINSLLPIQETHYKGETMQHTFARALYEFLGVKSRFDDWFRNRVSEYGFQENADYWLIINPKNLGLKNKQSKETRGKKPTDYRITLDMAKELAMVERNEQGKQARRYFIQCEKALQRVAPEIHTELLTQWKHARELAKSPYKLMCNALERCRTRQGNATSKKHYINESNMITSLVIGGGVLKYKAKHAIKGDIRAHLNAGQLEQLEYLERADEVLLDSDITDFEERRLKLFAMLNNRFKRAA